MSVTLSKPLTGAEYVAVLKSCGLNFFTGVPCSLIRSMLQVLTDDKEVTYFPAVREDSAISMAMGAWLAGKKPMVLIQNSGLGNSLDVILSLQATYNMPLLMLVTWRGYEHKDEPQHWLWGDNQNQILTAAGIDYTILSDNVVEETKAAVKAAYDNNRSHALILKRGTCIHEAL